MQTIGIAVVVLYTLAGAVFAFNVGHVSDRTAAAYPRFYEHRPRFLRPAGFGNDRVGYWRMSGAFMLATGAALLALIGWIAVHARPL